MKVSDLLESRQQNWRELESLVMRFERLGRQRIEPGAVLRFSTLYRSACADLALADSYQIPPATIQYLHRLVGRAHNQLYRTQRFKFREWGRVLLFDVPRKIFADQTLRLAFVIFWGTFLISMYLAHSMPGYAEQVVGKEQLEMISEMHSRPLGERGGGDGEMAGFYIMNNTGIGLRCFAFGLVFGVGGLFITVYNASLLGAVFGYMIGQPNRQYFFEFVTAHGPFELTAIVFSAAAGMRLGFAIVEARGRKRSDSVYRAAVETMPIMGTAIVLFGLAALVEGFLSPSALPYALKVATAIVSALLLVFYYFLGIPRRA